MLYVNFIVTTQPPPPNVIFFFFNDTATTEIYTLSLHDALPICAGGAADGHRSAYALKPLRVKCKRDRKSTRLNSSHTVISYAVFCLKKKINRQTHKKLTRCHNSSDDHRCPIVSSADENDAAGCV